MKILFITRGFPSKLDLMLGNYESVQARALSRMGHEVINICAPRYKSELHIFDRNRMTCRTVDGVKVYERIGIFPYLLAKFYCPLWLSKMIIRHEYKRLIEKVLRKEGIPDVVHIHLLFVAYYAISTQCLKSLPVVITEHWSQLGNVENTDISWMSAAYTKADALIAVSKSLGQFVQKWSKKSVLVINNMVDDKFWDNKSTFRGDGSFHFITVGRLCDDKHFDMLIEAFAKCKFPSDSILDIVGDGENRKELEQLINNNNLEGNVILHGLKSSEEVAWMLTSSNCFVLSSKIETFGIVLIEAMSKGLPVIATRCGGPEEFVTKDIGFLVPNNDCSALAEAMKRMRVEVDKFDKENIKKYCYDNFSQTAIANKIVDVYKSVIKYENRNLDISQS